jgi:hypothetical protein
MGHVQRSIPSARHADMPSASAANHLDVVRLHASGAAINLHTRRVDDVIAHAILFQRPMDPEPVIAGLIAANELNRTLQLAINAGANLVEELSQLLPALHRVLADFVRQRVLTLIIQLFLPNSIAMRQRTAPSWVAAGGRLFTVRESIGISYAVGSWNRDGATSPPVAPLHRI